ncbi:unnamed protein product [Musa acuminata subsp. malaccensis]|uniref:(wild Malaysian banana) hypothetical protein n=1 Tax=Musa acuminata subsp. malaccensis TaxID=214687 RepID=A0A804KZZ1_MUSAM|nr:PREDICTED: trihelix transcription factor ASIL1-like [Musa acuminata subsp. malaccensis]XP_018675428.1 PREDICTED: trihelix transcription factor ASIL1-like [Musa acuminata subsp. malaccensis]XP_018675429.1 PREDICTED: trihelix transcription factor ASIL1-like [Musa acuminata subsp. malaccensis]CAG1854486.1 unnamed protein product [Musa acuminata subsp. malaccensis]
MATAAGSAERRPGHPALASRKSAPGQPWSHIETAHLIDAYEERWYALKRGQLKARQWEDVAAAVAGRCGLDEPSKTGTQCRHKVEKLRKRYRAERLRPVPSAWPFFNRMERMERGPLPITFRPPPPPPAAQSTDEDEEDDDDREDEDEDERNNTRSINGILRDSSWNSSRVARSLVPPKRRGFEMVAEDEEENDEDESEEEAADGAGEAEALSQMAAVVRGFGDRLVRMEKRRRELMREMKRDWMEMETKRAEMLMESQRCLLEKIAGAFPPAKKPKKSHNL